MKGFPRLRRLVTRENIARVTYVTLKWGDDHVPFGLRSVLGILFLIGGIFGFLPIVGFWMLPLGAALIALDIPWTRHKIHDWMVKLKAESASSPLFPSYDQPPRPAANSPPRRDA